MKMQHIRFINSFSNIFDHLSIVKNNKIFSENELLENSIYFQFHHKQANKLTHFNKN